MNNIELAKQHGGKKMAFKDLPEHYQLAMVWYMAVDGSAWDQLFVFKSHRTLKNDIRKSLPEYIKKHGRKKFGMVEIPVDVLKREVVRGDIAKDFKDFGDYHKWYIGNCCPSKHSSKNRWPCIMDSTEDDVYNNVLEDGWHRFHDYIRAKHKDIPCIYYLPKIKY